MTCNHKPDSACPFACTNESEMIQNYGCLPTPHDIVTMRTKHNKTWACHEDTSKPCKGALEWLIENDLPHKVVDNKLITERSDWEKYCE